MWRPENWNEVKRKVAERIVDSNVDEVLLPSVCLEAGADAMAEAFKAEPFKVLQLIGAETNYCPSQRSVELSGEALMKGQYKFRVPGWIAFVQEKKRSEAER